MPSLRVCGRVALRTCARKSTGGVAEQFRLDQILWNGCAVDGDKRATAALATVMDCAGKELFAHTRLAFYQDGNGLVQHTPRFVGGAAPLRVTRVQTRQCILQRRYGFNGGNVRPKRRHRFAQLRTGKHPVTTTQSNR